MAGFKRRWKIIVMLVIYVGVAVGGYAYFAAQNPTTQLNKVASSEQLTAVEKETREFLSTTIKAYVFEDQTEFKFVTELGGIPLTAEAQKQGTELMKQHFADIASLSDQERDQSLPKGTVTTSVEPYSSGEARLRPLPNRQAGIAVGISVEVEMQDSEQAFSNGLSMELGIIVDGPTNTITSVLNSAQQGW